MYGKFHMHEPPQHHHSYVDDLQYELFTQVVTVAVTLCKYSRQPWREVLVNALLERIVYMCLACARARVWMCVCACVCMRARSRVCVCVCVCL